MPYPGGKARAGVYQLIINQIPPHRFYIEPFLGGGAIMQMIRPAAVSIGIDKDPDAARAASANFGGGRRAQTRIIHGDADKLVPIQQAELIVARLKEAGVPVTVFGARETTHSKLNADLGKPDDPATKALVKFLETVVKK